MEPGSDRKAALVTAAHEVIASAGLEGLRLRTVAADVGIDHSTLHHHFPTKEVLLGAVVERAIAPLRRTLPKEGSASERCHSHLSRLADQIESDPDRFAVLTEFDLRARRDARTRAAVEGVEAGWRAALGDLGLSSTEIEFLIATVKGVRLSPDVAQAVLGVLGDALASSLEGRDA